MSRSQVEDSCQFQLCGTHTFGAEFGPGLGPSEGSCSGDCHQLAVSLVTNRFTRDFLWSKCADMCSDKYNFSTYRWIQKYQSLDTAKFPSPTS